MFHPSQLVNGVHALSAHIEREALLSEDIILTDEDQAASNEERDKVCI